jgi:DNA-binding GntR family transcriptional regulator
MADPVTSVYLTSTQFAAERIREAIETGRYGPGLKLWQDRLAKELNISRIPVREALFTLASEGLVTLLPNRGAMVPELSADELEELYALGATLESMAAKRGVARLTPSDLKKMKRFLGEMRESHDEPETWYALNRESHSCLLNASGWPRVVELVHTTRRNLGRYLCIRTQPVFKSSVREWDRQHAELYRACAAKDSEKVAALIEGHWRWTNAVLAESLKASDAAHAPRPDGAAVRVRTRRWTLDGNSNSSRRQTKVS